MIRVPTTEMKRLVYLAMQHCLTWCEWLQHCLRMWSTLMHHQATLLCAPLFGCEDAGGHPRQPRGALWLLEQWLPRASICASLQSIWAHYGPNESRAEWTLSSDVFGGRVLPDPTAVLIDRIEFWFRDQQWLLLLVRIWGGICMFAPRWFGIVLFQECPTK